MALLDLSLGPILLGTVLNVWLYGIMFMQTVQYYVVYSSDRKWIKVMVAWLFIVDTLNTAFDIGLVWRYTISLFGQYDEIGHSHWLFNVEPVMTTMISSTTQSFYAWRIAKLTGHVWIGWILAFMALVQFGAGLGTTIWASILVDFDRFQEGKSVVITWLGLSALVDVLITCALTWHLLTHRTGFPETDDVITKLVRSLTEKRKVTVQTGLITSIWASVDLITFLSLDNNLHLFFQLPLCKLYTNTLMSTLNARRGWGGHLTTADTGEITSRLSASELGQIQKSHSSWRTGPYTKSTTVQITTTVHRDGELDHDNYAVGTLEYPGTEGSESFRDPDERNVIRLESFQGVLSDKTLVRSKISMEAS